jgi:hypothetical protein
VFAEFERAMIQERVRAGLARARAEGKQLGRPKIEEKTEHAVQTALRRKNRPGLRKIAAMLGWASEQCSGSAGSLVKRKLRPSARAFCYWVLPVFPPPRPRSPPGSLPRGSFWQPLTPPL